MDQQAFEQAVRSYWTVRESQAAKQLASGKVDVDPEGPLLAERTWTRLRKSSQISL
jgi:hypothetical protein